jgi:cbb3-type cytochrome oxidase subunit 3
MEFINHQFARVAEVLSFLSLIDYLLLFLIVVVYMLYRRPRNHKVEEEKPAAKRFENDEAAEQWVKENNAVPHPEDFMRLLHELVSTQEEIENLYGDERVAAVADRQGVVFDLITMHLAACEWNRDYGRGRVETWETYYTRRKQEIGLQFMAGLDSMGIPSDGNGQ